MASLQTMLRRVPLRAARGVRELRGRAAGFKSLGIGHRRMFSTAAGSLRGKELLVCDMAGTVVAEGGQVYIAMRAAMNEAGLGVSESDMHPWHGAKKEAVIEHFVRRESPDIPLAELTARIETVGTAAMDKVAAAYFDESSNITLIHPDLLDFFAELRAAGTKVALDTGYPPDIQEALVNRLGFKGAVDGYISAYSVSEGRPYPYMIHQLMETLRVEDVRRVAKAGDSVRDVEEGKNAGCGLVVGVLSGADDESALSAAGADLIVESVMSLRG